MFNHAHKKTSLLAWVHASTLGRLFRLFRGAHALFGQVQSSSTSELLHISASARKYTSEEVTALFNPCAHCCGAVTPICGLYLHAVPTLTHPTRRGTKRAHVGPAVLRQLTRQACPTVPRDRQKSGRNASGAAHARNCEPPSCHLYQNVVVGQHLHLGLAC